MRQLKVYTSKSCGPCKSFKPTLVAYAQLQGLPLVEVDIDQDPVDTAKSCVRGVPTTMLIENGIVLRRHTGSMTALQLQDFVK